MYYRYVHNLVLLKFTIRQVEIVKIHFVCPWIDPSMTLRLSVSQSQSLKWPSIRDHYPYNIVKAAGMKNNLTSMRSVRFNYRHHDYHDYHHHHHNLSSHSEILILTQWKFIRININPNDPRSPSGFAAHHSSKSYSSKSPHSRGGARFHLLGKVKNKSKKENSCYLKQLLLY